MADVCVTVPKDRWTEWLTEGDLPGEAWRGGESFFYVSHPPRIAPGERVYVVSHGRLRGYAPLEQVNLVEGRWALRRRAGAVACTIPGQILGFRGVRYRWWDRTVERPFPEWKTP